MQFHLLSIGCHVYSYSTVNRRTFDLLHKLQLLPAMDCSGTPHVVDHCSPRWSAVVPLYFHCTLTANISSEHHKISLTKVIRYVSWVTTIFSGSPLDPWGPRGTRGGPRESNWNFSKSKYFANKSCQVCFRGDKNAFGVTPDPLGSRGHLGYAPGGQIETATNQKISLTIK